MEINSNLYAETVARCLAMQVKPVKDWITKHYPRRTDFVNEVCPALSNDKASVVTAILNDSKLLNKQ